MPGSHDFDFDTLNGCLEKITKSGATVLSVDANKIAAFAALLPEAIRRCYADDAEILSQSAAAGLTPPDYALQFLFPDQGSVMSGDFGEILLYFVAKTQAGKPYPRGPRKWRWKNDRTHAAPKSDVVLVLFPAHPQFSKDDELLCHEVKAKATPSNTYRPIQDAVGGAALDQTGRLAKTLAWFKERSVRQGADEVTIGEIDRFIQSPKGLTYKKTFRAVAVVDATYVDDEVKEGWTAPQEPVEVWVVAVADLKASYKAAFAAAAASLPVPLPGGV